jgi:hypothetical protein
MDALPSDAELSTTTSTGTYRNYDNIKVKTTFTIYNKPIDVTTDNASYTTTGRLDETLRATIWVFVKYWSFYDYDA